MTAYFFLFVLAAVLDPADERLLEEEIVPAADQKRYASFNACVHYLKVNVCVRNSETCSNKLLGRLKLDHIVRMSKNRVEVEFQITFICR